ncbi:hypothetical protein QBC41DRAFT_321304 [Cercophora samala]|uniref:Uncharacterized protein n=1 Tax=Cercophora samala TaxID=330535 RepID=A0AA39ZD23_9PEZI|nr:hypothetical protein QBC41DRAFT_321304 [Cercophora samala]
MDWRFFFWVFQIFCYQAVVLVQVRGGGGYMVFALGVFGRRGGWVEWERKLGIYYYNLRPVFFCAPLMRYLLRKKTCLAFLFFFLFFTFFFLIV